MSVLPSFMFRSRHLFSRFSFPGFLSFNAQLSALDFPSFPKSPHQHHSIPLSHPLFSYSYALFCHAQNAKSRIFSHFRTLCAKHRGGVSPTRPWHSPLVATLPMRSSHYPVFPPPCTLYLASVTQLLRSTAPCLTKKS